MEGRSSASQNVTAPHGGGRGAALPHVQTPQERVIAALMLKQRDALAKNQKQQFTYAKAIKTMQAHAGRFTRVTHLRKYSGKHGMTTNVLSFIEDVLAGKEMKLSTPRAIAKAREKSGGKLLRAYTPTARSGAEAILFVLHDHADAHGGSMTKNQIIPLASRLCDAPMLGSHGSGRVYGAWGGLKTLQDHKLVATEVRSRQVKQRGGFGLAQDVSSITATGRALVASIRGAADVAPLCNCGAASVRGMQTLRGGHQQVLHWQCAQHFGGCAFSKRIGGSSSSGGGRSAPPPSASAYSQRTSRADGCEHCVRLLDFVHRTGGGGGSGPSSIEFNVSKKKRQHLHEVCAGLGGVSHESRGTGRARLLVVTKVASQRHPSPRPTASSSSSSSSSSTSSSSAPASVRRAMAARAAQHRLDIASAVKASKMLPPPAAATAAAARAPSTAARQPESASEADSELEAVLALSAAAAVRAPGRSAAFDQGDADLAAALAASAASIVVPPVDAINAAALPFSRGREEEEAQLAAVLALSARTAVAAPRRPHAADVRAVKQEQAELKAALAASAATAAAAVAVAAPPAAVAASSASASAPARRGGGPRVCCIVDSRERSRNATWNELIDRVRHEHRDAALLMRLGVGLHNLALGDYQWCFTSRDLESEEDEGWEKVRTLQHLGAFGSPLTPHIILHYYSSNLTYIASVFVTRTKIYNVSTDC